MLLQGTSFYSDLLKTRIGFGQLAGPEVGQQVRVATVTLKRELTKQTHTQQPLHLVSMSSKWSNHFFYLHWNTYDKVKSVIKFGFLDQIGDFSPVGFNGIRAFRADTRWPVKELHLMPWLFVFGGGHLIMYCTYRCMCIQLCQITDAGNQIYSDCLFSIILIVQVKCSWRWRRRTTRVGVEERWAEGRRASTRPITSKSRSDVTLSKTSNVLNLFVTVSQT